MPFLEQRAAKFNGPEILETIQPIAVITRASQHPHLELLI